MSTTPFSPSFLATSLSNFIRRGHGGGNDAVEAGAKRGDACGKEGEGELRHGEAKDLWMDFQ